MNSIKSFPFLCLALSGAALSGACTGDLSLRPKTPTLMARAQLGPVEANAYAEAPPAQPEPAYRATQEPSAQEPVAQQPSTQEPVADTAGPPAPSQAPNSRWQGPKPSTSFSSAPQIALGETLRGIVKPGVALCYRISLERGQTAALNGLVANIQTPSTGTMRILDADRVRLLGADNFVARPVGEFERLWVQNTVTATGDYYLVVTTNDAPMEFKVTITAPGA